MIRNDVLKKQTILDKNTRFLNIVEFNQENEKYIENITKLLLEMKDTLQKKISEVQYDVFVKYIQKENGLLCILALVGISKEMFERLLKMIIEYDDEKLNQTLFINEWSVKTYNYDRISKKIITDHKLAQGIVNLMFRGNQNMILTTMIPAFELKKFDQIKGTFSIESLIDTIIRYKIKGSVNAKSKNNAAEKIRKILNRNNIKCHEETKVSGVSRKMDFAIPNRKEPQILIEVSYQSTTSSSMGDKAKHEVTVRKDIKSKYGNCLFLGFIDGAGWLVRESDLEILVSAFDDVFTFNKDELDRFETFVKEKCKN